METVKIGIVGIGDISGIYLKNITTMFKEIEILAVCDFIKEKAQKAVDDYKIPKIYDTMEELFADEEIDIVLNLTRPYEHYAVTSAALEAGKHVYSEKPLGATLEEGEKLVALAEEKGLMLGGAPDTFMGAGIQTCRKLIEDGYIGDVISSSCTMMCHGHESWHPDPAFYYQFGGGPMMDMGPYYITALINLMGGIKSVTGIVKSNFEERIITSEPKFGEVVKVEVPTHVLGMMHFDNGAVGTIITTFDVYNKEQAGFVIYGTKGTLFVPDPNTFGGKVELLRPEEGEVVPMPLVFDYKENSRALGLADMAKALQTGREFRADYHQTLHVLEVLTSFERSSQKGGAEEIIHKYEMQKPMVNNPMHGVLD
ncbi:MAG: Gfo/Idh/MocA family oxidoreductase [Eubacteriales bacterium]